MEKIQLLAMIQAYTGIGIGLMIGLGAAGRLHRRRHHVQPLPRGGGAPARADRRSCRPRCSCCSA